MANPPNFIVGVWEKTGTHGGNPRRHRQNVQTPHRQRPSRVLNLGPWRCEAILPTIVLPCPRNGQFSTANPNYPHIFRVWEETKAPGGNLCKLHTVCPPRLELDPSAWRRESSVLTTVQPCLPNRNSMVVKMMYEMG